MAYSFSIFGKREKGPVSSDVAPLTPQRSPEEQAAFDFKTDALVRARADAENAGRKDKATFTDYLIAVETLKQERGVNYPPAVIADLSGQRIEGFIINKSDMEPRPEEMKFAAFQAAVTAQSFPPSRLQQLEALRGFQLDRAKDPNVKVPTDAELNEKIEKAGVPGMRNVMDLDGDGAFSDFYAALERNANYKGTVFSNVSFHPAGTLMRTGENGVALTDGAIFKDITFDGMEDRDKVALVGRDFNNVRFTNIHGGTIEIGARSRVTGMDITGVEANLVLGEHAYAEGIKVDDRTRILSLNLEPGSVLAHSDLRAATIDMASQIAGATLQDVRINANVKDVDFSGTTLRNVMLNGKPLTGFGQLAAMGALADPEPKIEASKEFIASVNVEAAGKTLAAAMGAVQGITPIASTSLGGIKRFDFEVADIEDTHELQAALAQLDRGRERPKAPSLGQGISISRPS